MISLFRVSVFAVVVTGGVWSLGWHTTDATPESPTAAAARVSQGWSESDLWLAPADDSGTPSPAARGVELLSTGLADRALPLLATATPDPVLGPYAQLHIGRAHLALESPGAAAAAAREVMAAAPDGYLGESALGVLAEALEAQEQWAEAAVAWRSLADRQGAGRPAVLLRLAQAAEKAGHGVVAGEAYARVFYEWPASPEARDAETALAAFPLLREVESVSKELARAERLYDARRFADAQEAWERVMPRTTGADRTHVQLRLAQCHVHLQRFTRGLQALGTYLARDQAPARAEAAFTELIALRGLKRADYPSRVARFVRDHPDSPLAERAMNELATFYILADDDGRAATVFTGMYDRFPQGEFAGRAAWRAGWWAYRTDNYREAIRLFESAAASMRRADYRPSWLYWTARAWEALAQADTARLWYLRTIADYRNSYYGREAMRAFEALTGRAPTDGEVAAERDPTRAVAAVAPPADTTTVRHLLAAGFWDDAIAELRRMQQGREVNPTIEATIAWALNRKGELRPAITAMRRAYPQFMSDGGELLPERLLKVIFPVAHRDTIQRYATDRQLDLYLVTALVAQESTFQADVRSPANAVGLMQLLPSTGSRYARRVGVAGFTAARLTDPEVNVRLGTAYLSDLLARFDGNVAQALAAYNAGENRVDRWRAERPGLERDEFTDDIPFPETQNYVKRIIGTTEDYRLLYGTP